MRLKKVILVSSGASFFAVFSMILFLCVLIGDEDSSGSSRGYVQNTGLNDNVLGYTQTVRQYAASEGIEDYVPYLLAIMMVESNGVGNDVMQASESLGLPLNSLTPQQSIEQGCKVFAQHLAYAEQKGCDLNTAIQAYNYGGGFIDYVAQRGGEYSFELAEAYSSMKSGGVRVIYKNKISIPINGGYRYDYGNMFYVMLVEQYIVWTETGSGEFVWPVPAQYTDISSYFGYRDAPTAGATTYHEGIDIPVPAGTDVYASKGGTVAVAQYNTAMGYYIVIDHGSGVRTYYCHNMELLVSLGENVSQGQVISHAGSTGYSTGPHLDFKVEINGTKVDPLEYVSVPE